MKEIAEVRSGVLVRVHQWPDSAVVASHKLDSDGGSIFRPYVRASQPSFDPAIELVEETHTIAQASVTQNLTKRSMNAQELDAAKVLAISSLNGTAQKALFKLLQAIANDNRAIKRKINQVITATGVAVTPFAAAQTTTPANDLNAQQFKDLIRTIIDA